LCRLQIPGAWLGAALWALHPLQVESVAWITEMKNTESCLFYLLTILFFLKGLGDKENNARTGSGWSYALTLMFAGLAIASKFSTVVLPLVLILCAWWVEGRWQWRHLLRLLPIFVISAIAGGVTIWLGTQQLALSWPKRIVLAGDVTWFYLGKLAWPQSLMAIYPRWEIDAGPWLSYIPSLGVIITCGILWMKRDSWGRPYFFALAYFLVVMFPFLGFINQSFWRYSFVEDHLQYLAGMGPLALVGSGVVWFSTTVIPKRAWLQSSLTAGVLLLLGILSWQRVWVYQSDETLWTDNLAKNANCWVGNNQLGLALVDKGQIDEAIEQYKRALQSNPAYSVSYNNLGIALAQKGQLDEAIEQYQKALEINPAFYECYNNFGIALARKGQVDEAIERYNKALEINPGYFECYNNLGNALAQKGKVDEAVEQFQKALEINPNYAEGCSDLATALAKQGRQDEALALYRKAVEIDPNNAKLHSNLGNALAQKGQVNEAIAQHETAVKLDPTYAAGYNNLGTALAQMGKVDEAIEQYKKAEKIDPNYPNAPNNFGNALLKKGKVKEAIEQYQRSLTLRPNYAEAHYNLGLALGENGQLPAAIAQLEEALRLKPDYADARNTLAKMRAIAQQKGK